MVKSVPPSFPCDSNSNFQSALPTLPALRVFPFKSFIVILIITRDLPSPAPVIISLIFFLLRKRETYSNVTSLYFTIFRGENIVFWFPRSTDYTNSIMGII